jgi:hypothetical protein
MKKGVLALAAVWMAVAWSASVPEAARATTPPAAQAAAPDSHRGLIDRYCVGCHNDRLKTGGLSLESLDPNQVAQQKETWEKVVRKVSVGAMPPAGAPRPDAPVLAGLVASLEDSLDRAAAARPNPGRPVLHRLNRAEYGNAVRDLVALDIDPASLLPADELSHGFDNIGDALGLSPVLLERYLAAADTVSALAVGDPAIGPGSESFMARGDSHQIDHIDGLPLGTRGGLLIRRHFPLDGDYVLSAKLYRTNNGFTRGLSAPHDVEFTIDGERVFLHTIGGQDDWAQLLANPASADSFDARLKVRVPVKAGPHTVGVTFVEKTGARNVTVYRPLRGPVDSVDSDGVPKIDSVLIAGPFDASGVGDTPSRRRIFTCRPAAPKDERTCATAIVSTLARRAFRRPVSQSDVRQLMTFYDSGRASRGTFEGGIQLALRRMLADPAFLFRAERDPAGVAPGATYAVSDLELASRLSFFLWSSIPDEALLRSAEERRLRNQTDVLAQVRRMLADDRSASLVSNFAGQWLQLRNLARVAPDPLEFPDFDDDLRRAFRRETELLFESIVRDDRSVLDLLTADYTFVNERLARHYGMKGVTGSRFRRVAVADPQRRGLLGHGSILAITSHPNRTSPVKRGKWILENLMGSPPPPPPPNVPIFEEKQDRARPRTMRERMEEHRRNPTCANCHRLMDPIGLAMENFDGIGGWRARDGGVRIDASTQLADGTTVNGVVELRDALLRRPEVVVRTLTENLMTYALGRALTADDMPAVRAVMREAARSNYRFSAIVTGIVTSAPFRMRMRPLQDEDA